METIVTLVGKSDLMFDLRTDIIFGGNGGAKVRKSHQQKKKKEKKNATIWTKVESIDFLYNRYYKEWIVILKLIEKFHFIYENSKIFLFKFYFLFQYFRFEANQLRIFSYVENICNQIFFFLSFFHFFVFRLPMQHFVAKIKL